MIGEVNNKLLIEKLDNDAHEMQAEYSRLYKDLNEEQEIIYNTVLNIVENDTDCVFSIYGHGGTGKTYLW